MSFKLFSAARHRNCFHWSSIQVFSKSGGAPLPKRALFFLQCAPAPILWHSGRRGRVNGQVCSSTAGWWAQCTQGVCSSTRWYAVCQCSSTPLSFVSVEHLVARYFSISSLFSVHTFHTVLDQANYLWYLEISVWVSWSSRISFNLVFSLIGTNKPTNKNNIFPDKAIFTGTWNQHQRFMLNNSASCFSYFWQDHEAQMPKLGFLHWLETW